MLSLSSTKCEGSLNSALKEESLKNWRYSVYHGRWSRTRFVDILFRMETDYRDSWFTAVSACRNILKLRPNLVLEGEVNIGKHSGIQEHFEINGLAAIRWNRFPWDDMVDISVAYGIGPSYAFGTPVIEERRRQPKPGRFLLYMMFEAEGRLAFFPEVSAFLRIHHRSGVFGVIRERQGSNIICIGIRGRI